MRESPKCLNNNTTDIEEFMQGIDDEALKLEIESLVAFLFSRPSIRILMSLLVDSKLLGIIECTKYLYQHLSEEQNALLITSSMIVEEEDGFGYLKKMFSDGLGESDEN